MKHSKTKVDQTVGRGWSWNCKVIVYMGCSGEAVRAGVKGKYMSQWLESSVNKEEHCEIRVVLMDGFNFQRDGRIRIGKQQLRERECLFLRLTSWGMEAREEVG